MRSVSNAMKRCGKHRIPARSVLVPCYVKRDTEYIQADSRGGGIRLKCAVSKYPGVVEHAAPVHGRFPIVTNAPRHLRIPRPASDEGSRTVRTSNHTSSLGRRLAWLPSLCPPFFVLFDLLLWLHGGEVDIPDEHNLENDGDKNNNEDGEQDRLIVEYGDGLWCGADATEPVELTHLDTV